MIFPIVSGLFGRGWGFVAPASGVYDSVNVIFTSVRVFLSFMDVFLTLFVLILSIWATMKGCGKVVALIF